MTISRRNFLTTSTATLGAVSAAGLISRDAPVQPADGGQPHESPRPPDRQSAGPPGFDPWLEIDAAALRHNVATVARLSGRPVIVVAKNNAYGLGLATVGPILDPLPQVWGFAVVRADEALTLRGAGVKKPILLMGLWPEAAAVDLVRQDIRLAPFTDDAADRLRSLAAKVQRPIAVHLYIDTGMGRMGMPVRRADAWISALAGLKAVRIEGAFTELTEDAEFDLGQAARLRALADRARQRGVSLGMLHAASSDAIAKGLTDTFLDAVRPGLAIWGGYVSDEAMARGELRCAYRLKARVVRVELLHPGDGVSYHRRYLAERPTWIAALPTGHVDGYPARATQGGEILIRGRAYRVIGTVSASHTVVEVGPERTVEVGDEATLVGPDTPAIHPNEVARRAKYSEYDMFMHLSPLLPRKVV